MMHTHGPAVRSQRDKNIKSTEPGTWSPHVIVAGNENNIQ